MQIRVAISIRNPYQNVADENLIAAFIAKSYFDLASAKRV